MNNQAGQSMVLGPGSGDLSSLSLQRLNDLDREVKYQSSSFDLETDLVRRPAAKLDDCFQTRDQGLPL